MQTHAHYFTAYKGKAPDGRLQCLCGLVIFEDTLQQALNAFFTPCAGEMFTCPKCKKGYSEGYQKHKAICTMEA